MNRRQKIIVSVTGIFLVMLILVGLTYAYFLTQITGNTKDKSISVTTANLQLTYGDGNGVLEVGEKIIPGQSIKFKSGETIVNEKTFTVTNSGDNTSYVVIVDNVTVTPEPFKTNDFEYSLTCKSYNTTDYNTSGTSATETGTCAGVTSSTFFLKNESILVGNKIDEGITHVYSLTMEYEETGQNQSEDMGKTFTARINIEDIRRLDNPYASNTSSLAYNIINNSLNGVNGTKLVNTPPSKVAEEISTDNWDEGIEENFYLIHNYTYAESEDEAYDCDLTDCDLDGQCVDYVNKYVVYNYWDFENMEIYQVLDCDNDKPVVAKNKYEKVLSVAKDDFTEKTGLMSYYYRGNVDDNYVNFAEMCWRIVRIDGNGNIKLILEDQNNECSNENADWTIPASDGESITMYNDTTPYKVGNWGYEEKNINNSTNFIMNYLNPGEESKNRAMVNAFKYFQTNTLKNKISSKYENKKLEDYLASGNWCLGDKPYTASRIAGSYEYTPLDSYDYSVDMYYDSYTRLISENKNGYNPTLKCNGTVLETFNDSTPMYVATLTADEVAYAGGSNNGYNYNYYLMNNKSNPWFWTLSLKKFSSPYTTAFIVYYDGYIYDDVIDTELPFRPAVTLKSSVEILNGGNGTKDKPYVIK